ncbi:MAG: SUMF1/EgtB/PvdO family nonheme iron enzyme [Candidatus Aegiribacteria sp.]|nr:SUMF1/EgtB/PvdO family nonheme iron enzyme [Candidatus Aegiribacteria sp.]MBD3294134.1 SUMF1/EgtB/PvdO family nonheme iron enzyme [Candidatus Fermentibacteria bacterium]
MRNLAFLAAALLLLSCGDTAEETVRPDPLPITEKDTAFVAVPGGTFIKENGDTVEIEGFRLGRYEVTNRLYYYLAEEGGIQLPPDPEFTGMDEYFYDYPDYPVVNVSMEEASAVAAVLGGRLPTAAEWQYAASMGLEDGPEETWAWGTLPPEDAEYPANYLAGDEWETRGLDGYLWTAPVDSFPLTDEGFACFSGNVAEWTLAPFDSLVPVCGGAWLSPAEDMMLDAQRRLAPGDRARHIGFRILLP